MVNSPAAESTFLSDSVGLPGRETEYLPSFDEKVSHLSSARTAVLNNKPITAKLIRCRFMFAPRCQRTSALPLVILSYRDSQIKATLYARNSRAMCSPKPAKSACPSEWLRPSRFKMQPCLRKCSNNPVNFIRLSPSRESHR